VSRITRDIARGAGVLDGLEVAYFDARGARPGPRLCLLAGIHGCEYSSIAAVIRFMRDLDPGELSGSVVAVPVANPASFRSRTPFVSPADGKNLNRCFPGDPDGSFSEALADLLFGSFVRGSDALLDLHGGDMVEALEPFALYDASPVEQRSLGMARAFGLSWVMRAEAADGQLTGMTSTAAAGIGIPAVIAEVGGHGVLEEEAVDAHLRGIAGVLGHLEMREVDDRGNEPQYLIAREIALRSAHEGWWEPAVPAGALVQVGTLLGTVSTLHGDELERFESPKEGVVLFVTTSPAVSADSLLLGIGTGISPLPSTPGADTARR